MRSLPVLIAALCFSFAALSQPADKKTDPVKGKDDKKAEAKGKDDKKGDVKGKDDGKTKAKEPAKAKPMEKAVETPKEPPKAKTPFDRLKLSKDAIVIILEDPLEALPLFGKLAVMEFDKYLEREERIKALERQLKPDRKVPFSCDLTAELVDEFLYFDAEFLFSTEAPNTSVVLGLQGGHLYNRGKLDGEEPIYDHNKDDGFVVKVAKEEKHRLTCSFRVPVTKAPGSASGRRRPGDDAQGTTAR
jgi:hypothetical protein